MWVGKALGGLLGLAAGGAVGSVLGVFLGHQFDQSGWWQWLSGNGAHRGRAHEGLFLGTVFAVMGHIAKVDGRVSEEEIEIARRIMREMQLAPEQVHAAIDHFTRGKRRDYPLDRELATLAGALGSRRDLARAFVEIQTRAVIGVGALDQAKRELLWRVAQALGVGRAELAQIEAAVRAREEQIPSRSQLSLEEAFRTLGLSSGASDQEIKTAYRRLMNQHHPDKLASRGLPAASLADAEQKTRSISAAYDRVKTARGIK